MKPTLAALLLLLFSVAAFGQLPPGAVTLVVPYPAGSPADALASKLAGPLAKNLNATVLLQHQAGYRGTVGAARVFKSKPDGQTLLLSDITMATSPTLFRKLQYKVLDDFEFLGLLVDDPLILVAPSGAPVSDFTSLRKWLDSRRRKARILHTGFPDSQLCAAQLQQALQIPLATEAFKPTSTTVGPIYILAKESTDLLCLSAVAVKPSQIQGNCNIDGSDRCNLKAIATTAPKRPPRPPAASVPTTTEFGLSGVVVSNWYGIYAPKGTPAAATEKFRTALGKLLQDPTFIAERAEAGSIVIEPSKQGGAQHKKTVEAEIARWAPVLKAAGQYAD